MRYYLISLLVALISSAAILCGIFVLCHVGAAVLKGVLWMAHHNHADFICICVMVWIGLALYLRQYAEFPVV